MGCHFAYDSPPHALPKSMVSISFTLPTVLWLQGKHNESHAVVEKRHPPLTQMAAGEMSPSSTASSEFSHSARISADLGTVWCVDPIPILDGSETLVIKLLSGCICSISVQFSSVAQSCLTLCDPMDHSTPGLPVHHQLPEFTQTHAH